MAESPGSPPCAPAKIHRAGDGRADDSWYISTGVKRHGASRPFAAVPICETRMNGRVVITGANSAVGQAMLRLASRQPPPLPIVAAVRSDRAIAELAARPGVHTARISYDDASSLDAALAGASAAIHLAGILIERPGSTYEQ